MSFYVTSDDSNTSNSDSHSSSADTGDSGDSATGSLERNAHQLSPVTEVDTPTENTPGSGERDTNFVLVESIKRLCLNRLDEMNGEEKEHDAQLNRVPQNTFDLIIKHDSHRPVIHALSSKVDDDVEDSYIVSNFEPGVVRNRNVKTVRDVKHRSRDKIRAKTIQAPEIPLYTSDGIVHYV